MDTKLTDARARSFLIGTLCVVYFTSYITRLDYATVIAQIVVSEGILKSDAALATTACFITYGAGQLISGWLGDRISPKWLIFSGLALSALCNLLLPLAPDVGGMVAVWAVNGFAQALLWPPMMRLMAGYLDGSGVEKCCVYTSIASSSATVVLYVGAPVFLSLWAGWRSIFYLASAFAVCVTALWLALMTRFEKRHGTVVSHRHATAMTAHDAHAPHGDVSLKALILGEGLVFVMVGIVMQGTLRDGVTTWLPSYLVEVFHLGTGSSILSSVVLPVFSILSFKVCAALHNRFFKNEISLSALLFAISLGLSLAMAALFTASAAASVLLAALLTGCMHGINLMLICNLPARFAATGRVATVSGVLNACTYVGSALSTYGFALVAQNFGWRTTVVCWAAVCAVGCAACLAAAKKCRVVQ